MATYIDAIAAGEDVTVGKPDPTVFLIAFERLGVQPEQSVVIEDAPAGVKGAVAAGAACVAVTNNQSRDVLQAAGADLVVSSLSEVTIRVLEQLVQRNSGRRQ
jgi:beta-phosphoglucomutase-like phosphatase (HAD superfamily)